MTTPAITFDWVVESMDCYPSVQGQTDVVKTVRWRCNATDGTLHSTTYGSVDLDPYVEGSSYTAYASLAQVTVIDWVKAKLDAVVVTATADIETKLAVEITTPAIISYKLPWA